MNSMPEYDDEITIVRLRSGGIIRLSLSPVKGQLLEGDRALIRWLIDRMAEYQRAPFEEPIALRSAPEERT